jgi:hypothetical protein
MESNLTDVVRLKQTGCFGIIYVPLVDVKEGDFCHIRCDFGESQQQPGS